MGSTGMATVEPELLDQAVRELRHYAREVHENLHDGNLYGCDMDSCDDLANLIGRLDAARPRPLTAEGLRDTLAAVRSVYDARGEYEPIALAALAWGDRAAARIAELEGGGPGE
jgi:hypothetical protein